MSTVTEIRKTKQKWCLNPRGKAWSEDSNKFGQKMLEKMGWSRGKGLGRKENGMKEHIKVPYKNDMKGMGFKETDNEWTEHDIKFNTLLQSLSGKVEKENDIKISSLEKKSKSSKARVHYKKFTRGKDLSRRSEKDLANIFGKKTLKATPTETEEKVEEKELPNDGFSHNGGSMVDYFKKKLPNFMNTGSPGVGGSSGVSKWDSESEGEVYAGFGSKTPDKNKKRKSKGELQEGTPKKFKSEQEDQIGLSNPAFDPFFSNVEVQKHVLNTITEEVEAVEKVSEGPSEETSNECINAKAKNRKNSILVLKGSSKQNTKLKKGKISDSDIEGYDSTANEDIPDACLNNDKEERRQKPKKKEMWVENPNFEDGESREGYFNENFEVKRKEKKTKDTVSSKSQNFDNDSCQNSFLSENFEVARKKENKEMALVNPVFDSESIGNSYVNENFEVTRKKMNKQMMALDNPNFDDGYLEVVNANNNFEVKRKKKKKKKTDGLAIDNPTFNTADDSSYQNEKLPSLDEAVVNGSEPEARKKRKKQNEDATIDSSIQNLSIIDSQVTQNSKAEETNIDLILNVTSTPIIEETKSVSDTPKQVKRRKSVRFTTTNAGKIVPSRGDEDFRNELFDINTKVISNGFKNTRGRSNLGFNRTQAMIDENVNELSRKIDGFQAEIENDMNEAKSRYVGEVGNPDGENEKLPEGTRLKFKYAKFGKLPHWAKKETSTSKSSYKHLIKGDIIVGFNNTNLHEIKGYAEGLNSV